ncbi:MAG: DUF2806 domain-containing protein [Planctomycetaceae bacterium]|nr:DUF2806 domain-containing protein [Planctomycetaceae bacterium]
MDAPGEKLLIRLWETITEKGIGGLLRPWQFKREARALLEVRHEELVILAQAEKDAEEIRTGRKRLRKDGPALTLEPSDASNYEPRVSLHGSATDHNLGLVLQQIATENIVADAVRREVNVAKALLQAEAALENDCEEPPQDILDEDWLYRWRDCASQVSTERLQSLWGSLLAGEIKSPGRFSLRTLDFLRNLSQGEAKDIELLFRYTLNDRIVRGIDYWEDRFDDVLSKPGITFGFLCRMHELGIVAGVESGHGFEWTIKSESDDHFLSALISHDKMLCLQHKDAKKTLQISGYPLTIIGQQLARIGVFTSDESYVRKVGEAIASNGYQVLLADTDAFERAGSQADDGPPVVPGEIIEAPKRSKGGKSESTNATASDV